jgi:hypothetical protein
MEEIVLENVGIDKRTVLKWILRIDCVASQEALCLTEIQFIFNGM